MRFNYHAVAVSLCAAANIFHLDVVTANKCPVCYDGEDPTAPSSDFGRMSCKDLPDFLTFQEGDDDCFAVNVQATWSCGCPSHPPPRSVPKCSLCAGGGLLTKPNAIIDFSLAEFGSIDWNVNRQPTCEEAAAVLSYSTPGEGWEPYQSCRGFQDGLEELCGCEPPRDISDILNAGTGGMDKYAGRTSCVALSFLFLLILVY